MAETASTKPRFLNAGDTALTVELGATAELGLSLRVLELYRRISAAALSGVVEVVPALRSLTVHYDPCVTSNGALRAALTPIVDAALAEAASGLSVPARRWVIPACYAPAHAPDIEGVAATCGLDAVRVAALHASVAYRVLMIGFLPGHPYLGELPAALRLPRHAPLATPVPSKPLNTRPTIFSTRPCKA